MEYVLDNHANFLPFLHFINPGSFDSTGVFLETYGNFAIKLNEDSVTFKIVYFNNNNI